MKNVTNGSNVLIANSIVFEDFKENTIQAKISKQNLDSSFRKKFITDLKIKDGLIGRKLIAQKDSKDYEKNAFYGEPIKELSLEEVINANDKIILLGNPGLGKSTELEKSACDIWKDKSIDLIPIYRNLKNFTEQNTKENFLKIDIRKLSRVIFIFDGVDELSNIQDFISKLEHFISLYSEHKFLISCRSNIYADVVKRIDDVAPFLLTDLSVEEGLLIVKRVSEFNIELFDFPQELKQFVKTPFQASILGEYIKTEKSVPLDTSRLWETYIHRRLDNDSVFKFIRHNFSTSVTKKNSKKISLINELVRENVITEERLFESIKTIRAFEKFKKNPLIIKSTESNSWSFEHKSIQEYFAALFLSENDFDEIINFIQIKGIKRTHPSLQNTIRFLLNILELRSEKHNKLLKWVLINEPKILFKTDHNRISNDTQKEVFQNYFNERCIKTTLWFNQFSEYSIKDIAAFSDCISNFEYLIQIIKEKKYHYRIRYSAFDILQEFELPPSKTVSIIDYIKLSINDQEIEVSIKSQIIKYIKSKRALNENKELVIFVIESFDNEENNEINSALLDLIHDRNDLEPYYEFISKEFQRSHKIISRNNDDNVQRGNDWKSNELILKYKDGKKFVELAHYFFSNKFSFYSSDDTKLRIQKKLISFLKNDKSLFDYFFYHFKEDESIYFWNQQDNLYRIITESYSRKEAINYLLSNFEFYKVDYLIARILNEDSFNTLISVVTNLKPGVRNLQFLRNSIFWNNKTLGRKFEKTLILKGVSFDELLKSDEEYALEEKGKQDRIQDNLSILFEPNRIIDYVSKEYFEANDTINIDVLWEFDDNGIRTGRKRPLSETAYSLLHRLLISKNKGAYVSLKEFTNYIENPFILFVKINQIINEYKKNKIEYFISESETRKITNWVKSQVSIFEFNSILEVNSDGSYQYLENGKERHEKLKIILDFKEMLNLELDIDFLLEIIQFDNFSDEKEEFERIESIIGNSQLFRKKIIDNINNNYKNLPNLGKHVKYALKNRLFESYRMISHCLINHDFGWRHTVVTDYYEVTNDTDTLFACCQNSSDWLFWASAVIISKLGIYEDFCVSASVKKLEEPYDNNYSHQNHRESALSILFEFNRIEAIEFIVDSIDKNEISMYSIAHSEYNAINDFSILSKLYNYLYEDESKKRDRRNYRGFFVTYVKNIASQDLEHFNKLINVLKIIKTQQEEKRNDLFYINSLIKDSINSYQISQSKPLEFKEALRKVESFFY